MKVMNSRLLSSCVLSLIVFVATAAIADYVPPPKKEPPSDYSKSGGVRGCSQDNIPLTILAPQTYVGQTSSRYPTFAWFVSNSSQVEFRLYEFDASDRPKQIGKPILVQSSPGITTLSLPQEQPGLSIGQKYLWQVAINCPLGDLIERAEFRVVEMPSVLSTNISTTKDGLEKAQLYAKASLWYEALGETLKLSESRKPENLSSTLLQELAKSEEPEVTQPLTTTKRNEIQKRLNSLKKIVSSQN